MKKRIYIIFIGGIISALSAFFYAKKKKKLLIKENRNIRNHHAYGPYEKYFKRFLDIVLSIIALIILSPIMLIIAILVKVKLGSPVLFKQERPGMNERVFKILKYRTMTEQKDATGKLLSDSERLTSFGRILRQTSLDELPELINILKGDMSIVGPRPLLVSYLPYYTDKERQRHDVRPGLSGLAQINGRNYLKWDDRLALDIKYVNKITFLGDMKIIFQTVGKIIARRDISVDAYASGEGCLDEERHVEERC